MEKEPDVKDKLLCELCGKNKGKILIDETHYICGECYLRRKK